MLTVGAARAAVPERQSFPEKEEEILAWWEKNDTFRESVRQSEGRKRWSFYDGPPFATGLPHYGHILAGTIKVSSRAPHGAYRALEPPQLAGGRRPRLETGRGTWWPVWWA